MPTFRDWIAGRSAVTIADDDEFYVRDDDTDTSKRITWAATKTALTTAFDSQYAPVGNVGGTDIAVADGGTGASSASTARANLEVAPVRSLYLTGTAGNNVTTPDAAAFTPATSQDIRAAIAADDWTPSTDQTIVCQYDTSGNQRAWSFGIKATTGYLYSFLSSSGSSASSIISTVAPSVSNGGWLCVRRVWAAATPDVKYYTKPWVSLEDMALDTGWTQLGTTLTATVPATIFDSSASVSVGELTTASLPFIGKVAGVIIIVDGTTVASPSFLTPVHPRYVDVQSKVWTFNGSAWSWANPS